MPLHPAVALACALPAQVAIDRAVITESFEQGLAEWTADAHIGPQPGFPFEWSVTPSSRQAFDGAQSLEFFANGEQDDGTVWIERTIDLPAGLHRVDLTFHAWSEFNSIANNWIAVAAITAEDPEAEADFTWLGELDTAGWVPFKHDAVIGLSEPGQVYVALGYTIVFETQKSHFFDLAEIEITNACPGDVTGDGAVGSDDLNVVLESYGCTGVCAADANADGAVNSLDLNLVLANFGDECL